MFSVNTCSQHEGRRLAGPCVESRAHSSDPRDQGSLRRMEQIDAKAAFVLQAELWTSEQEKESSTKG